VFVSSDHSETTSNAALQWGLAGYGLIQIISVNRAGSVPPVAADLLVGASVASSSGVFSLDNVTEVYYEGIAFSGATGSGTANIFFGNSGYKALSFKNCSFTLPSTGAASRVSWSSPARVTWNNCTVKFGNVSQAISSGANSSADLTWLNTVSAIQGATLPATLFVSGSGTTTMTATCRGVDLSALTGSLLNPFGSTGHVKILFDSCNIASGVTRLGPSFTNAGDEVELVNCFDGTNVLNERHTAAGDVTTDHSTTLSSGAADDIGLYSLKLTSASRSDKLTFPLDCFWLDVENTAIGVAKTATVEIISSASLNNDDISLLLEYMGTSGSSLASFLSSLPAVVTAGSALPSSSNTWTGVPARVNWNPADLINMVLSNSNLTATASASSYVRALLGNTSGKYYFEMTMTVWASPSTGVGIASGSFVWSSGGGFSNAVTGIGTTGVIGNGAIFVNGVIPTGSPTLASRSPGDIIGIAVDIGAQLIWFRVAPSGNWNGSGTANPATGIGGISISGLAGVTGGLAPLFFPITSSEAVTANFGGSTFSGAVPASFTSGWSFTQNKQLLQVPFTPQRAGRVRGLVRLGRPSAPVWVNPQITVA
jgi:hypothetical protein